MQARAAEMTTDLRATTWEDAAAKTFRFNSQNLYRPEAEDHGRRPCRTRRRPRVGVNLSKPSAEEIRPRPEWHILSDRSHAPHHRGCAGRTDAAGRAGIRRLRQWRQDLRHAQRDRRADRPADKEAGRRRRQGRSAVEHAPLAGQHQLFRAHQRQAEQARRTDAGLFDPFRIVRERHFARAVARLQRLRRSPAR